MCKQREIGLPNERLPVRGYKDTVPSLNFIDLCMNCDKDEDKLLTVPALIKRRFGRSSG